MRRSLSGLCALSLLALLLGSAWAAPDYLPDADLSRSYLSPGQAPPFGTDQRGRALLAYALQGARIVVVPALVAGGLVALLAVAGGLVRCLGKPGLDAGLHALAEVVGALPRMVVLLVVAMLLPASARTLLPLAVVWAFLCAPDAFDEAGAVAERLGGARVVEALRAHGFSWARIYGLHLVAFNLRPVVVRQGAEALLQVVFLEVALSYLSGAADQASLTHADRLHSWADLLQMGYPSLVLDVPTHHALFLGLGLCALLVVLARATATVAAPR
jgi:ABC-type dipeptide/oligopeptide/nickel transport system permease subunit